MKYTKEDIYEGFMFKNPKSSTGKHPRKVTNIRKSSSNREVCTILVIEDGWARDGNKHFPVSMLLDKLNSGIFIKISSCLTKLYEIY